MTDRKFLSFIEIDIPFCDLEYGVSPCQAELGVTGSIKCFNSLNTCQDTSNFDPSDHTFRFVKPTDYLPNPLDIEAIPNIKSIQFTPGEVSLGEDLGTRSTLKIVFTDHPWSDTWEGYDKYVDERSYDPFSQGTYWGKFRARQPFVRGKTLRWITGFLGQSLEDMEVRTYILDSFDGPNAKGEFTLIARDVLKKMDGDRAQAPTMNNGSIISELASTDTSLSLSPTGIGDEEYSSSGYIAIGGNEICEFTRSGDSVTLTERGALGTEVSDHDAGSRVQQVLHYSGENPATIIEDLLTNYAGVDGDFINTDKWQDEVDAHLRRLYGATIPEPTPVKDLVIEIIRQAALAIWWNDVNQSVELRVLKQISTQSKVFGTDEIIEDSLRVEEQPRRRVSQVWIWYGQANPLLPLDEKNNYRNSLARVDALSESDQGSPAIQTIFSRWIPSFGDLTAQRLADIIIGRFKTPPRRLSFSVFRHDHDTPSLGEGYQVQHPIFQDETGAESKVPIQVSRFDPRPDRIAVEAQEMLFSFEDPDDLVDRVIRISADINNINLRDLHDQIYPDPSDPVFSTASGGTYGPQQITVRFVVEEGVTIGSTSTSTPAVDVGDWPAGVPISLEVRGRIQGKGGEGGRGGEGGDDFVPPEVNGSDGGPALKTETDIDLILDGGDGQIWGGGGGGGGGDPRRDPSRGGGGGGGGSGTSPGDGGEAGPPNGNPGEAGTPDAGGIGGEGSGKAGDGGEGGNPGQDGNPGYKSGTDGPGGGDSGVGGDAGAAIDGISFVTKTGTGDIRGAEIN